jgi:tetrahydromethanopterin S-methyltransferase subunit G
MAKLIPTKCSFHWFKGGETLTLESERWDEFKKLLLEEIKGKYEIITNEILEGPIGKALGRMKNINVLSSLEYFETNGGYLNVFFKDGFMPKQVDGMTFEDLDENLEKLKLRLGFLMTEYKRLKGRLFL